MKSAANNAFTILELLIVISIIGILATVVLVSINPNEQLRKAKTSKLITQFNQIEKAFRFTYLDESRSSWWIESEMDLGPNPTLKKIINIEIGPLSTFSNYFSHASIIDELTDSQYQYDHDSNASAECDGGSSNWHKGANLGVTGLSLEQKKKIDIYVDTVENYKCGKITYGNYEGGSLYWRMNLK